MTYLGIDLGTSGVRVLLIDQSGTSLAVAEQTYPLSRPHAGWSEQNPSDWIQAIELAIAELRQNAPQFIHLRGIGVSGHMHGAVCLDNAGDVLRPCIMWNDTRAAEQARQLDQSEPFRRLSGNIVFPGFTAPKLVWLRENEPETFSKTQHVLLPAAYINHYLTGEFASDRSDCSGTSWLDIGRREWSDALLTSSHLSKTQMPGLFDGSDPIGNLRPEIAQAWGLKSNVMVAAGAGDNAAAACGMGVMNDGQGSVSLGTSGVVMAAQADCTPAPDTAIHTFCHAVPNRWYQMGVMLSATDSLNWLAQITGQSPSQLTAACGKSLKAPSDTRFLPYLSGERTPHNDADIRGSFTGLDINSNTTDLTQAVIEGVSFGLRDSLEALQKAANQLDRVTGIGGGMASEYWVKLLATVLQIPIELPAQGEFGAALGAARLGQIAAGDGETEDVMKPPKIGRVIEPDMGLTAAFDDAYQKFRASYRAIKSIQ